MENETPHYTSSVAHGNPENVKAFKTCTMSDGKPCPSCQRYMDIDERINKLLAQKRELLVEINRHHDIVSRLPPEIGSKIFECYLEDYFRLTEAHDVFLCTHPRFSPLTLGAVCQTWRRIAWSSPQLWTHVQVIRKDINGTDREVLQQWLSRSRQLPLSWVIVCRFEDPDYDDEVPRDTTGRHKKRLRRFISIVNQQSHRWKNMRFTFTNPEFYSYFNPNSGGAPILRRLCLDNKSLFGNGYTEPIHLSFGNIKLHPIEVRLSYQVPGSLDIDWSHLTRLCLDNTKIRLGDFIQLLRQAPLLEIYESYYTRFTESTNQLSSPFTLPVIHHNIKDLLFSQFSGNITPLLLDNVVKFPSLTRLIYDPKNTHRKNFAGGNRDVLHHLPVLIKTSCARITSLMPPSSTMIH